MSPRSNNDNPPASPRRVRRTYICKLGIIRFSAPTTRANEAWNVSLQHAIRVMLQDMLQRGLAYRLSASWHGETIEEVQTGQALLYWRFSFTKNTYRSPSACRIIQNPPLRELLLDIIFEAQEGSPKDLDAWTFCFSRLPNLKTHHSMHHAASRTTSGLGSRAKTREEAIPTLHLQDFRAGWPRTNFAWSISAHREW